jgi:hypothetical protein
MWAPHVAPVADRLPERRSRMGKFAVDSPLEGDGFEPSVPLAKVFGMRGIGVRRPADLPPSRRLSCDKLAPAVVVIVARPPRRRHCLSRSASARAICSKSLKPCFPFHSGDLGDCTRPSETHSVFRARRPGGCPEQSAGRAKE